MDTSDFGKFWKSNCNYQRQPDAKEKEAYLNMSVKQAQILTSLDELEAQAQALKERLQQNRAQTQARKSENQQGKASNTEKTLAK